MPIYEFECNKCDKITEVLLTLDEKPPKKCEFCTGGRLKKLISLSSFQLKGDGWYSTDYSKKPKSTSMSQPKTDGQDATKQNIEKKDNKAVADSISKDIKKAKG